MEKPEQRLIETTITVRDVMEQAPVPLTWVAGKSGGDKTLEPSNARFPGAALVGYLNPVHLHRVQVIGPGELQYYRQQAENERTALDAMLFNTPDTVLVVLTDGEAPPGNWAKEADRHGTTLATSPEPAPLLINSLQQFLIEQLADRTILHGVLLAVYGMGVLITGDSGVGKSELGLELISRNHRLVADDAVEVRRSSSSTLTAQCPTSLRGHLEVRGLGILNIREMFGFSAVLDSRPLDLIVRLERAQPNEAKLDRLQIERTTQNILGVSVPSVTLFTAPGRNLAVLVEAAVRDTTLRRKGRNAAATFIERHQDLIDERVAGPGSNRTRR